MDEIIVTKTDKKPKLLIILDIAVIIILIASCLYINHEKSLVKDIAAGRTNPCSICINQMNYTCYQGLNRIESEPNSIIQILPIINNTKN